MGIHHITAIAGDPQRNLDFYTGTLGLRLIKVTVNFDALPSSPGPEAGPAAREPDKQAA